MFDIKNISGLSESLAKERLLKEGYNELPASKSRGIITIALGIVKEPMFLLLLISGSLYFFLGDIKEGLMLLSFVVIIIFITIFQERKTEKALERLRDLSSPRALVVRDGVKLRIPGREVVREDIIILGEGDRVPADSLLLWAMNLVADESLLTGESMPVKKKVLGQDNKPDTDTNAYVYASTLIVSGQAVAKVIATGINTQVGKIGKALESVKPQDSLLQKELKSVVKNLALLGLGICLLIAIIYGFSKHNWVEGFLAGITLAMAALPEEFPVVFTIFLALGAWRLSQRKVLTRYMPAIETLGTTTVLCVDKTGTITFNQMSVKKILVDNIIYDADKNQEGVLPEKFHEFIEFSILASKKDPFDPMEKAFKQFGSRYLANTEHIHQDWQLVHEYPLSESLLALSHVWKSPESNEYTIATKGAPEAIADLCHFNKEQILKLKEDINILAAEGLRVLGVAKVKFNPVALPDKQHDFDFVFLGLVGLSDPIRPNVLESVKECQDAGIRVIMITGDYPATARNIGNAIILDTKNIITGQELDKMDDLELSQKIKTVNIFARVVPEQKLRLVNALKANGEIVAMTGDGVNDAPALKSAHIGVAMGGRGTDVAREAADLVLLDDAFSSIVGAVKLGRRIFDNIQKAMVYIVSIHIPIIGMSLIPVLFRLPLVLFPVHIVFLELIIDPACSTVFEAEKEEDDVMNRLPRKSNEPLFSWKLVKLGLIQGVSVLFITSMVFLLTLWRGLGENEARAMTFTTLIFCNIGLILANRYWHKSAIASLQIPNKALWWVLCGTFFFLALVLYVSGLRNLFHFAPLHLIDIIICALGAGVSILVFELFKLKSYKKL